MKTITTTIKWRNAAEELPERSCEVVVFKKDSGYLKILPYSAKHGVFNAIDLEPREAAIGHCIAVDYWCHADEIRMALTTFPKEKPLHGKFELARGKKKIKFREEAEKEEAEKNAFAKALKERFADLVSEKSQTGGESVIKMTNEEAIKILKVNAVLSPKATEFCEAVKIAVAAIEKQMPQKPLKRPFDYSELKGKSYYENYDNFLCPSCKKRIISNINGGWVAGRRQKYCDKCGQALDWEGIR